MKEIQTNGITILLVEATENQINDILVHSPLIVKDVLRIGMTGIKLPSGQYQILGKSTELSEEQMKEICEHCKMGYLNYKYPFSSNPSEAFTDNLQESYLSLLESNGIVDRNPISDEQKNVDRFWQVEWQEAQSKVKHYLVLKRI